jgi:hypothetical protein
MWNLEKRAGKCNLRNCRHTFHKIKENGMDDSYGTYGRDEK